MPALPRGFPAHNPIDHFIGARIAQVAEDYQPGKQGGIDFHREIKPILEAKCYNCHQGTKVKGGLRLDVREQALLGGNGDRPRDRATQTGSERDVPTHHQQRSRRSHPGKR